MSVDLSSLHRTVARLEAGLARFMADPSDTHIRDGLIQQFEFTYDMAPKMLRRVLRARADSPTEIDEMSFPTLMRTAFGQGLIDENWVRWLDFRKMRNETLHTYDEDKAKKVAVAIPVFLDDVRELARRLELDSGTDE